VLSSAQTRQTRSGVQTKGAALAGLSPCRLMPLSRLRVLALLPASHFARLQPCNSWRRYLTDSENAPYDPCRYVLAISRYAPE
jgi:hypothetical protein